MDTPTCLLQLLREYLLQSGDRTRLSQQQYAVAPQTAAIPSSYNNTVSILKAEALHGANLRHGAGRTHAFEERDTVFSFELELACRADIAEPYTRTYSLYFLLRWLVALWALPTIIVHHHCAQSKMLVMQSSAFKG
jgi:hypothetical protein